jgi:cardiolipin synthase A/B
MSMWLTVLLASAGTYLLTLIVRQFLSQEKTVTRRIPHCYGVTEEAFGRSVGGLLAQPFLPGNRVSPLMNGDEIFPAMLEAIRHAKNTINFETYIYWSGRIGKKFAAALCERARAGVRVHVLLDWLGCLTMHHRTLRGMKRAGVDVQYYHPLRWYTVQRANNRTHRKILIVDGTVGFTGGVGIADCWTGNAQDAYHWRDSHFKLEGPAVAQMQAAFMDNWVKTKGGVLHGDPYFPPLEKRGTGIAQVFQSSPSAGSCSMRLMYQLAIAAATESIRLSCSYFVPDNLAVAALLAVRQRGVRVQIIVPGDHIDSRVVRWASRSRWGPLLEAGVEISEYQPTMYHCKVMIVDDLLVSVGSTNFDSRSFHLNDEANLNVLDADLARQQIEWFERDQALSRPVRLEEWRRRPLGQRIRDFAAGLLRSQL